MFIGSEAKLKLSGTVGSTLCRRISHIDPYKIETCFRTFPKFKLIMTTLLPTTIRRRIKTGYSLNSFIKALVRSICQRGGGALRHHSVFVCFVALRPKSTAMVMAGRSVHLIPNHTFSWASLNKKLTSTSNTYFRLFLTTWICSQTRICCQTHVTDCATQPGCAIILTEIVIC